MNRFSLVLASLATLLALFAQTTQAGTCVSNLPESNPNSAYTVDAVNGTATDNRTGLMWKICAEGQTWSNGTCANSAQGYTWANALAQAESAVYANQSDWRLPNLKELRSLVEECRINPSINDSVFPNAPSSYFWSGSPYAYDSNYAWVVGFYDGNAYYYYRNNGSTRVRLVRGGQSSGALTLAVNGSGTGSGIVISAENPAHINCTSTAGTTSGTCSSNETSGASIALTATPAAGSTFVGWSGDCTGTGGCVVTMTTARNVTASFQATATAPGAPTITRLIPGNNSMRVVFNPPTSNGGSAITGYTATCTGNGVTRTATGASSPLTVTGLTNGLSYSCSVVATNGVGSSASSASASKVVKRSSSIAPLLPIIVD